MTNKITKISIYNEDNEKFKKLKQELNLSEPKLIQLLLENYENPKIINTNKKFEELTEEEADIIREKMKEDPEYCRLLKQFETEVTKLHKLKHLYEIEEDLIKKSNMNEEGKKQSQLCKQYKREMEEYRISKWGV